MAPKFFKAAAVAAVFSASLFLLVDAIDNPEEYVNILGGTDSRYDISHGGTLPLITRPWGFNSYAPQTDDDPTWPGWWFHPSDRRYFGLRVTHQPSPWIKDYGNFYIRPYMPSSKSDTSHGKFSGYSPQKATFSPYYFKTDLLGYGMTNELTSIEFTPTSHAGIMRATFPTYVADDADRPTGYSQIRRVFVGLNGGADQSKLEYSTIDGAAMFTGYTTKNSGGVGNANASFAHYFAIAFYNGPDGNKPITDVALTDYSSSGDNAWIDFAPENELNKVITIRFATSFISKEQAIVNLYNEVDAATRSFEDVKEEAKYEWNQVLRRVDIQEVAKGYTDSEVEDLYTIFYSSLYRASVFPRQLTEVASDGTLQHWSPYATSPETRVMPGEFTTDSGFWDAWNTVYPLLTLVNRPVLGTMMQGWVNSYKEGGWLPKWASPGYRGSMVGTMGDVSLADAIVKNIPGFDKATAYEAIRKDAFEIPPSGVEGVGRVCLEDYLKYGYIPRGASATTGGTCDEIVARGMNYLQSDYAISQAAQKLGFNDDYQTLYARSMNYTRIFDPETRFFRSKYILTEKWTYPFDQYDWGGDYTESGPWQYRFYVPHDPKGLAKLYEDAGTDMCTELENTQTSALSIFHLSGYGNEIHEQTELPDHCWGQYAHNNQPAHHMLYMYMVNGYGSGRCGGRGQYWIRKVLNELYKPDAEMFAGDEDNGEMGAWYVLSSLGLYELSPGGTDYVLGSPHFSRIEIDISDIAHTRAPAMTKEKSGAKKLTIIAHNNAKENVYVQSVRFNGEPVEGDRSSISYEKLAQGGVLYFEMGPTPVSMTP